ncbi:MAG TPA: hypothetical protein VFH56_16855 [Acidimicrobiales bacterium]|nr:hypothetical protein [Acidimicrobiales bacterium]
MPKEKINNPRRTVDAEPAVEKVIYESPVLTVDSNVDPIGEHVYKVGPVVQVGWHKDAWVQVSIEADPSYFRFAAEHPDGETSHRSTVYSEPLNRDELNKLIRTLRRARDQVFGRDE